MVMKLRTQVVMAGMCLWGAGAQARAAEAQPCGGVDVRNGRVTTTTVLTEQYLTGADGQACLKHLGKDLAGRRLVRSVTVAVRVPDAQRADGKALALARSLSDVVVQGGMPRNRVFALVPRTQPDEPASITVAYTERSPENVVAAFHAVEGDVRVGDTEATMKPAEPGGPILGNERVTTGRGSRVWVKLKDGSGFKLGENADLKLLQLEVSATLERQVKLQLVKGDLETEVKPAGSGSTFETSTKNAVAAVRGTGFRMRAEEDGQARLETLHGLVTLAPKAQDGTVGVAVDVPAGRGAGVTAAGKVEAPRVLLGAPAVSGPQKGALARDAALSWTAIPGARTYRVELARDADFTIQAEAQDAPGTSLKLATRPAEGKWFWRVSALDDGGFQGQTSKVYAFTVAP
jgi:hypothetical protein